MPKGDRGSRGKSRGKPRYVRLAIRAVQAPKGFTREKLRDVLIDSIYTDDYALPRGLIVEVGWSNHRDRDMKWDEWRNAMIDSAVYGSGWDRLMLRYLDNF